MILTPTEQHFILWALGIFVAAFSFIGSLGVKQLMKISKDMGDIKITLSIMGQKHDNIENRVKRVEEKLNLIEEKVLWR